MAPPNGDQRMKCPLVGVSVIINQQEKVLLGKRMNAHGAGSWAFPGGHLEWNETIEECAKREVYEETGLRIKNVQPVTFTNDRFIDEQKHYVTLFVTAEIFEGKLHLKEPDKAEEWAWFSWDELPQPLFLPIQNLQKSRQKTPFI